MDSNKCQHCFKTKELVCCKSCMISLEVQRIGESLQGDIADRVQRRVTEVFDERFEELKSLLNDKQIVCIKRGRKMQIV